MVIGCEIDPLSTPNWYVDGNLPFLDKYYSLMDLLKDEENIYVGDSSNVYFNSTSNTSNQFAKDIKGNGIPTTTFFVPSQVTDTLINSPFDDSTYVTRLIFLDDNPHPSINLSFNPSASLTPYTIRLTIDNLIGIGSGQPYTVNVNVSTGVVTEQVILANYTIINSAPSNLLVFRISTTSPIYEPVSFSYGVTPFLIQSATGKIKPVNLGIRDTLIDKPFGDNSVRGQINFGSINPAKTYLVIKRSKSTYQADFKNVKVRSINWNGRVIQLQYPRYETVGAPPQPLDTVFNLRLPAGQDSMVFYVNTTNSNILQFIGNIPKQIELIRTVVVNQNYNFGEVDNTEDLKIYFSVEIPLHFSIVEPTTLTDTVFRTITNPIQRERLQWTKKVDITFDTWNNLPLMGSVRVIVKDSMNNFLFNLTSIVTNATSDSLIVPAAPVDFYGYVTNEFYQRYTGTLDSNTIPLLLRMNKIIFEYKLYTDPNQIPTPDGRVRIRATDYVKGISYGTYNYRIH